jgi:hypothetical protein
MFTIVSTAKSWGIVFRGLLAAFALLLLAPIAAVPLGLLAFLLVPVAVCGIPFLLVSFLGGANTEHQERVLRASYRPQAMVAHAHA